MTNLDPVFAQMVAATDSHARAIPELTERERTFLGVVADVCQSSFGFPFETHLRTGLSHGVSTADVRSLLRFISYDCGYHAATEGFARLAEFEARHDIARAEVEPLAAELLLTGVGAPPSPLPGAVRDHLMKLDVQFLDYFDLQSRMRSGHGPDTLTERERGLASLSVDVHYQTLNETFRTHIGRALRGGASRSDVRAALRFNAQFGVTRAWHAWQSLNAYFVDVDGEIA